MRQIEPTDLAETYALAERARGKRLELPGYFSTPITVEAAEPEGTGTVFLRVRTTAGLLEEVPVAAAALERALASAETLAGRSADPADLFLLVEASRIRLAYAHDPYFAVSLSGVEALPHQLEAVYERMLPQGRLRFLLAHDPGAGKTIMAGLLMKELKLRGALDRVLVVCPAPLTIQWQDEMHFRFEETFEIIGAELGRNTLAGSPWQRFPQVITSLDFVKQPDVAEAALRVPWDLVVIDEAHKCSAQRFGSEVKKTLRYSFGEAVSRQTDRLLLMTATPHQGNADQFELFLRLLDEDQFVGLDLDREMIALDESPWFSRRIKEELRDFDGRPLFTRRTALTQPFELRSAELDLYVAVTDYINTFLPRQSGRRRTSVALARSVLQRRLASSLGAIEATLVSRHRRFMEFLEELERLPSSAREKRMREMRLLEVDPEIESDDADTEDEDRIAEQATVAERLDDLRHEVRRLNELIAQTRSVRASGDEAKLTALKECLERAELRELQDGRGKLLIFTEYRATQDYLAEHLRAMGFSISTIHGGMDARRRKDAQIDFQTDRQICIATEAAGEGINLQFCHLMINYDMPWNPNRLEQRMGRIHRIGQRFDVTVFNFVAQNTVEGRILLRLLVKLDEIRRAMRSDRVFDVIGTLLKLNGVNLEEMLREAAYNPTSIEQYEAQIEAISEDRLHEYERATGIALATRQVNLERVRPKDWRSDERRLMPEYVERFFAEAAERVRLRLELRGDGLWRIEHVPQRLRAPSLTAVQRFGVPADSYRKLTFHKERLTEDRNLDAELISPGHPLFASAMDLLDQQLATVRHATARFIDPFSREAYRLYAFESQVLGELPPGSGRPARSVAAYAELTLVRENEDGAFELAPPDALHDLTPGSDASAQTTAMPDDVRRAERWLQVNHITELAARLREARRSETAIRRDYLERSFHELIKQKRNSWAALASRVAAGEEAFKLARDEAQRNLEETERRRQQKLDELTHLEALRPGPVTYLGCAVVEPVADPKLARIFQVDEEVERAAVEVAMAHERRMGWEPEYVGDFRDGSGFDIRSTGPMVDGARPVRRIEVKGRAGTDATVVLTPNEWTQAGRHGPGYWLYVVTEAMSDRATLRRIQDPHRRLEGMAESLTVVRGYALPSAAIQRVAEVGAR
jgi:superfamily II DNA or RNA helicase